LRSLWKARQAKQLARTFACIQHHAVIPLLDADSANGYHYLVWPETGGDSLAQRVAKSGPLPQEEVIGLLAHLADALHACHIRQIIHGALTPHAVALDVYNLPRLLELGTGAILAANLHEEESLLDTLSGGCAATSILKFAAPEFITNALATPASDQYALGMIGYFALTGETPFGIGSAADLSRGKIENQTQPPSKLAGSFTPRLARIIDRMLSVQPSDRYSGLDEVQDQLAEISGGLGLVAQQPGNIDPSLPEPLSFLELRDRGQSSGTVSWSSHESGGIQLPARDESDASITFDLPPVFAEEIAEPEPMGIERSGIRGGADQGMPPSNEAGGLLNRAIQAMAPASRLEPANNVIGKGIQEGEPPALGPNREPLQRPSVSPSPVRTSPAQSEDLHMAKPHWSDPFEGKPGTLTPPKPRPVTDPRKGVSTPVHYHTEAGQETGRRDPASGASVEDDRPVTDSLLWKKVKRNLLFWQKPMDIIQVSIFGPAVVAPGQPAKLTVYLHTPETTASVRMLSRAFHHDVELIGSGYVAHEVSRETLLGIHLSIANAGVSKSLLTLTWRGQPNRLVFDLHVPWESPSGPAPGLVSIGRDNVRIGKIEFRLTLLPREG
jgi:serine/threonine protein kinase